MIKLNKLISMLFAIGSICSITPTTALEIENNKIKISDKNDFIDVFYWI